MKNEPAPSSATSLAATGTIARSAGLVGWAVMMSRLLGLVREQVFAGLFGAGYAYDAFVVAFRIPNLLRDLFGEGALSAAFITVFTDYSTKQGQEATWRLANNVLMFIALLLGLLALAGMLLAGPIVALMAPDFALVPGKTELTVRLARIMFPYLAIVALAAVVMAMLNTRGRFFIPALSSSFFNLGSIVVGSSVALLAPRFGQPPIVGMAVGTLVGGLLQLGVQLPTLHTTGFRFLPVLDLRDPGLRRVLTLMLPATIGLSATQINIFINTTFAASCAEGSVSWLNYAFRLVQLPIGLFGVAFSIAAMPVLARHAAQQDRPALRQTFISSLVMVLSLTIPASAGLILLSRPIIRVIFEHGAFTAFDTLRTAEALSCYALGLFAYSSVKIMVPVFYAINATRWPVIASFLAVAGNIVVILLTIDSFQHRAIALATSCTMAANCLFLGAVLYRKLGGYSLGVLLTSLGKIAVAALLMAAALGWGRDLLAGWLSGTAAGQITALLLLVGGGAALYGLALFLLRVPEFVRLTDSLLRRLRR